MNSKRRFCIVGLTLLCAANLLMGQRDLAAQVIDVLNDTIILNNGAPQSANTQDAEDNFGGRVEVIIGNNVGNARGALLRFDVSPLADAINDPTQVVSAATLVLNTADARVDIQPVTESIFDVYALVPENEGWFEGSQLGSQAGWSGEPGAVSQLYLANPEFEPDDALGPGLPDEFDEIRLWLSGVENDETPVPFEIGIDTHETSMGAVSTGDIDEDGNLFISLDSAIVNSLLPDWLSDPEENPGIYVFPTERDGQWFFESNEGFEDEAIDLVLVFSSGMLGDYNTNGELDAGDLDLQAAAIVGRQDPPEFDLNGDELVNFDDRLVWVKHLKNSWIGDANLDLEFNSGDMVQVFVRGKYEKDEVATWEEGDWNGDQRFNSGDMVAAFADGGYEQGKKPAQAVGAVPEPTSLASLAVGALFLIRRRR